MNEISELEIRNNTVLQRLGLQLVRFLKPQILKCKNSSKEQFILKFVEKPELIAYKDILPLLISKYQSQFKRLILPQLLETDHQTWVLTPFYDGKDYNDLWNEREAGKIGGIGLNLELSKEMAEVLADFSKLDINSILKIESVRTIEKFSFNFTDWFAFFSNRAAEMVNLNLMTDKQIVKAKAILGSGFSQESLVLTNGDYYPRNLINTGEKIVLVDWQGWEADFRTNFVDQLENHIAYAYCHMWFNFAWQNNFIKELSKLFKINRNELQKGLLIKSFDLAYGWRYDPLLVAFQLQIFCNALQDF